MTNGNRPIPKLNKPEYRVIFYHSVTGDILKYKFGSIRSAEDFMDRLSPESKATLYMIKRIR